MNITLFQSFTLCFLLYLEKRYLMKGIEILWNKYAQNYLNISHSINNMQRHTKRCLFHESRSSEHSYQNTETKANEKYQTSIPVRFNIFNIECTMHISP